MAWPVSVCLAEHSWFISAPGPLLERSLDQESPLLSSLPSRPLHSSSPQRSFLSTLGFPHQIRGLVSNCVVTHLAQQEFKHRKPLGEKRMDKHFRETILERAPSPDPPPALSPQAQEPPGAAAALRRRSLLRLGVFVRSRARSLVWECTLQKGSLKKI